MIHGATNEEERNARFQRTITLLRDPDASFTAEAIYTLSDLDGAYHAQFRALWGEMPAARRHALVTRLVETAEMNFELDFSAIVHSALDDPDTAVRAAAIEGVLEDSPRRVIERLMDLAQNDPTAAVRAAAARALGQFVLLGELGKLPEALSVRLQDLLFALHNNPGEDLDVRRRALEAIGNCGHEDVGELIRQAYYADELPMRVSAVFAMGRSCDERWASRIMDELASERPEMRYEAARAAGELELRPAVPRLVELAFEDDREIQEMAIWALGEIGGKQANRALDQLAALAASQEDDELAAAVAEAQSASSLAGEDFIPLFDFSDFEDDLLDDEEDLLNDDGSLNERGFSYLDDEDSYARDGRGFFEDDEDEDDDLF
ncbi:MAG: HEAT repeat domain-containing protein [Anaerolineae bacterium]|nr:HEAT repeat domain-containing protein [Anaerolineae bacterium]